MAGFLKPFDLLEHLTFLSLKSLEVPIGKESNLMSQAAEALISVVLAQKKTIFGPGSEHAVGL